MVRSFRSFLTNKIMKLNIVEPKQIEENEFIAVQIEDKYYVGWLYNINQNDNTIDCLNIKHKLNMKQIIDVYGYFVKNFNALSLYGDAIYFNTFEDASNAAEWLNGYCTMEVLNCDI